jgi:hypothetical protein
MAGEVMTMINNAGIGSDIILGLEIILVISVFVVVGLFIYFKKMYNMDVEYWRMTGNNTVEINTRKARKIQDKGGNILYKLWNSNLKIKRPEGFDIVYRKNGRDHLKILRTGEGEYYFIQFNHETKQFTTIPADIAEWMILEMEHYFKIHKANELKQQKWWPVATIAICGFVIIVSAAIVMENLTKISSDVAGTISQNTQNTEKIDNFVSRFSGDMLGINDVKPSTAPG